MDEKEIQRLQSALRDAESAEASARTEAEGLQSRMRDSGADPMAPDNFARLDSAWKIADSHREKAVDLRTELNKGLVEELGRTRSQLRSNSTSPGTKFLESAGYRHALETGRLRAGRVDTDPVDVASREQTMDGLLRQRATFDNSAGVGSGLLTPDYTNKMVEQFSRPVRLLDLIEMTTTDTDTVDWVVENARTDSAAETAYGTALPESAYGFEHEQTTVRRAGHWIPATRGALADAGQARSLIDVRLMSGLRRRIESQALAGNGVGENLAGISTYSASYLTQALGADTKLDAIHKACTQMRIATLDAIDPVHLLIHPSDYEELVLSKDTAGNYIFGSPSDRLRPSIWGLQPIVTTLVTAGAPQVADFKEACTMWIREGAQVAASDQHSDFFLKGLVAIKAEMRLAFAVTQPKGICVMSGM